MTTENCDNRDVRGHPANGVVIDDVGKRLIEELQRDGRLSYAALAKTVRLSEAAVRQRVQRLLDAGVMQIVGVTDPLQVGFSRQAMVGVRTGGDARVAAERIAAFSEVDYVVITAGSVDLLVEVVCEDNEELLAFLSGQLAAVDDVRAVESFVYLRLVKESYTWSLADRPAGSEAG